MKLEFYLVITERDSDRVSFIEDRLPEGPLVFEMYPEKSGSLAQAKERIKSLGGKYGWAHVAKVIMDTDAPENQP